MDPQHAKTILKKANLDNIPLSGLPQAQLNKKKVRPPHLAPAEIEAF